MPTRPVFTDLYQVGMAVSDLDKTMRNWGAYGIGPWTVIELDSSKLRNAFVYNRRVDFQARIAICPVGKIALELVQPLDNNSVCSSFMARHGQGLQHVNVRAENYHQTIADFREKGIEVIQSGQSLRGLDTVEFAMFGSEDTFGTVAEILTEPAETAADASAHSRELPVDREGTAHATPILTDLIRVAAVVRNLDEAMKKGREIYGLGPWTIREMNPSRVSNMTVRGKRLDHAFRVGICRIGLAQWVLIEPLDDRSIYAAFQREHGEGLHHLAFRAEDYHQAVSRFKEQGIEVLQSGMANGVEYVYLGTQGTLGAIVELYNAPAGFEPPAPDAVYP